MNEFVIYISVGMHHLQSVFGCVDDIAAMLHAAVIVNDFDAFSVVIRNSYGVHEYSVVAAWDGQRGIGIVVAIDSEDERELTSKLEGDFDFLDIRNLDGRTRPGSLLSMS